MVSDVIFAIGAVVMAYAPTIAVLIVGRAIVGLGVGAASQIVPLYLSEVAPVQIRGTLVAANNGMITIGQVFASAFAFAVRPDWRLMLGCAGVPAVLQFFVMFCMPESPRWLGKAAKTEEQKACMARIYKTQYID